ncbi:MAG: 23S rRNA (adenine(2503)-C(2))-methyltransferase RlmN, partial [Treponema sp.]|nr:23S rRNA (adenine(2503)-C(2))-methyltransferase RlmN [Treponema sp.]
MYKQALAGLLPKETGTMLKSVLSQVYPDFRAKQICQWICGGARDFSEMKNLPLSLRNELSEKFAVFSSFANAELKDSDGTVKVQIILDDGNKIEAVILADGVGRKTACLSTQAGCAGACVFCKTGMLGLKRNLSAEEIVEELLILRAKDSDISHIVIMGMGEPLLNMDNLRKALFFFTSKEGMGISKRRITLSTAGIAEGIRVLADQGPDLRLALSLTSARDDIRQRLMPFALSNPLPVLKESLEYYQQKQKNRITLEAVLLGGINTSDDEAQAIAEFAQGLDCIINLIPWNFVEGLTFNGQPLIPPSAKETAQFAAALE